MLKSIGMICILCSSTVFGFVKAQHYARRPQQIRQLIVILQRLESEITYGHTPTIEVFQMMSQQQPQVFATIFERMVHQLNQRQAISLDNVWYESMKQGWIHSSMKSAEFEITAQMGHVLGTSDFQDQVKHLRLAMSQLQALEIESKQEQHKFESMWRSLGLLFGALIVILMY